MIIVIIMALRGPFEIFYNILIAPQTVPNTYAHVARAQSCASQVQHIERLSRTTCHVPRGEKGKLSY